MGSVACWPTGRTATCWRFYSLPSTAWDQSESEITSREFFPSRVSMFQVGVQPTSNAALSSARHCGELITEILEARGRAQRSPTSPRLSVAGSAAATCFASSLSTTWVRSCVRCIWTIGKARHPRRDHTSSRASYGHKQTNNIGRDSRP